VSHVRPLKTEFWHFVLLDGDMPEEIKRVIGIGSQANNGLKGEWRHSRTAVRSQPLAPQRER